MKASPTSLDNNVVPVYIIVKMNMKKRTGDYHHGALKSALIHLTLEKLSQGVSISELSMRSMANELNVSKDAPRKHFANFDALIAEVAIRGYRQLIESLESAAKPDLLETGLQYIDFAISNPKLYQCMYKLPADRFPQYPELEQVSGQAFQILLKASEIQILQKKSPLDTVHELALQAWAFIHGLSDLLIHGSIRSLQTRNSEQLRCLVQSFLE